MTQYTSYAQMSESEYNQFLKEFYVENGPKPTTHEEFDDLYEDDRFNMYWLIQPIH